MPTCLTPSPQAPSLRLRPHPIKPDQGKSRWSARRAQRSVDAIVSPPRLTNFGTIGFRISDLGLLSAFSLRISDFPPLGLQSVLGGLRRATEGYGGLRRVMVIRHSFRPLRSRGSEPTDNEAAHLMVLDRTAGWHQTDRINSASLPRSRCLARQIRDSTAFAEHLRMAAISPCERPSYTERIRGCRSSSGNAATA